MTAATVLERAQDLMRSRPSNLRVITAMALLEDAIESGDPGKERQYAGRLAMAVDRALGRDNAMTISGVTGEWEQGEEAA